MRISEIKIGMIFILVIFILIEGISVIAYKTAVLGQAEESNKIVIKTVMDLEEAKLKKEEEETLNLINDYRAKNGLTKLKPFSQLQEVAKLKAEDLVNNNYFAHTSPNLGTPFEMLQNNNIDYTIAGENLAGNTTPQRAVTAWINSAPHRQNILEEKFEYTGIYVIESPVYGKVFVQLFIGIN